MIVLLLGCNSKPSNKNSSLPADFFHQDSSLISTIPKQVFSPYDTLAYSPLLLLHKNKRSLLRKNKADSLINVFPTAHLHLLNSAPKNYSLKKIIASEHKLKIACKGSIDKTSNRASFLSLFPALEPSLFAYNSFDFNLEQHYSWDDSSQTYTSNYQTLEVLLDELEPKQIHYNFFAQNKDFQWEETFDSIAIFNALIPGRIMTEISDQPIFWQCDSCPQKAKFRDYFDSTLVAFPFPEGVNTQFRRCISYQAANGKQQKLIYFSSAFELDYSLNGRFSKGFMGLAILELTEKEHWKLIHFDPAFDYLGTFQFPPNLVLFQNTKEPLFLAEDHVGGFASPTYTSIHLYTYINKGVQKVLEVPDIARWNHLLEWFGSLKSQASSRRFDDLILSIEGEADLAKFDDYDRNILQKLSAKLMHRLKQETAFHFELEIRFEWEESSLSFVQKNEELKISPIEA